MSGVIPLLPYTSYLERNDFIEWHFAIELAKGEVEAGDTSNAQQSRMPVI
jgi:hypothetical protein